MLLDDIGLLDIRVMVYVNTETVAREDCRRAEAERSAVAS